MMSKLTPKQARFVEEYLIDLNATQAARRAGYSARTANEQGCRLLANVSVADAIAAAQNRRAQRTEVSADRVVAELAKIGFANMGDYLRANEGGDPYLDFSALTRDQTAVLQEVTVEDYVEGRGELARQADPAEADIPF
jgi:phage terminase small subunit